MARDTNALRPDCGGFELRSDTKIGEGSATTRPLETDQTAEHGSHGMFYMEGAGGHESERKLNAPFGTVSACTGLGPVQRGSSILFPRADGTGTSHG